MRIRPLALLLFFPLALITSPAALAATPTVSADFSKPTNPKNQMGFMHGAVTHYRFADSNPAVIARANELLPGIWRGSDAAWSIDTDVALQSGATPIHILSNLWNTEVPTKPGCAEMFLDGPLPFQNLNNWKAWVHQRALQLASVQPTGEIWVDIWNEPDWWRFWPTKRNDKCFSRSLVDSNGSKWLATFLAAEQVLRHDLGSRVKIIGPSAATSVWSWSEKLINFCASKGCKIDAISWHLCGGTQGSVDLIPGYTAKLRNNFIGLPNWQKATAGAATKIWMTEYMPGAYHLMPGALTSYWYGLEKAGVDGGALAEWNDTNARLDSLLERDGTPRSLWWAARAYAVGRAARVATSTNIGWWSMLASRQGLTGGAELMVGNNSMAAKPVTINLSGLTAIHANKTLAYQVRVLPQVGPGGAPMPTLPAAVISKQVAVNAGKAKIILTPPRGGMLLVQLQGS